MRRHILLHAASIHNIICTSVIFVCTNGPVYLHDMRITEYTIIMYNNNIILIIVYRLRFSDKPDRHVSQSSYRFCTYSYQWRNIELVMRWNLTLYYRPNGGYASPTPLDHI